MLETVLRFLKPTRASMVCRIWVGEIWLSTATIVGSMGAGWIGAPLASRSRFGASESADAAGVAASSRNVASEADRMGKAGCAKGRLSRAETLRFIPQLQEWFANGLRTDYGLRRVDCETINCSPAA